jgi:hypothetical protein
MRRTLPPAPSAHPGGAASQDPMMSGGVHLVQDEPDERVLDAEALIKGGRRRQIRRRWAVAVMLPSLPARLYGRRPVGAHQAPFRERSEVCQPTPQTV